MQKIKALSLSLRKFLPVVIEYKHIRYETLVLTSIFSDVG